MSTKYILVDLPSVEFAASESSSKIGFSIWRKDRADGEGYVYTGEVFTEADLLDIAVQIVKIASYVSEDAGLEIRGRLRTALDADPYLGTMPE